MKKLLSEYPELIKEWHPTKNGELKPEEFTYGSKKKVWWLCPKEHAYDLMITSRTSKQLQGCPYCSGKRVAKDNNLKFLFPKVASEWHPTKNGDSKPEEFTHGANNKVWWLCPKGHSYDARIADRTISNSGCHYCSNQSSAPELRILTELRHIFHDVKTRHKIEGVEMDVYVPKLNLAIEYDGYHFHQGKEKKDLGKNKSLQLRNIEVIRVRCSPLTKITENDLIVENDDLSKSDLNRIFKRIHSFCDTEIKQRIKNYIDSEHFFNENLFKEYLSYFPSPLPENSLTTKFPHLISEWDLDKNHPLTPNHFSPGSIKKVWWLCPKDHSYDAAINNRTKKKPTSCPYCSGREPTEENNLKRLFPKIASEWHPTKNGDSKPEEFTPGSQKKVWWLCSKVRNHSYDAVISSRTKKKPDGCPYCSGHRVSNENNLKHLFPKISSEWHPTKNGDSKPEEFTYATNKKVWWLCPKGHDYNALISSRTRKQRQGCPYCSGNRVAKDNNLQFLFPKVASEWHPTKNGELKPEEFTYGSKKKVWWLCPKGHSYDALISSRTSKKLSGCSYCSGKKVSEENNLKFLFPEIASEWHPTKNGELKPEEFTYGSKKKVWWLCPKGHDYDAIIISRTGRNSGCPYCSGRRVSDENNLKFLFPEIASEWHPTKNGDSKPEEFTHGSNQKVWWLCPKDHNYDAVIGKRTQENPTGCPHCYRNVS